MHSLKPVHGHLRKLNWRPSRPNPMLKIFQVKRKVAPIPVAPLDLPGPARALGVPIWDQGQLGSCTAHGTGILWALAYILAHGQVVTPSRLFIYYCERMMEGDIDQDNGAIVADGVDALLKFGVPPETEWPYIISKFAIKPPALCWSDALKLRGLERNAVPMSVDGIRASLQAGYAVSFGFTVFESFMSDDWLKSGIVPMPEDGEREEGGHCVAFVGDSPTDKAFWVRNSWGPDWARGGRCLMPYEFLQFCSDGWNLPKVA